jgi:hypothetical protein
MFENCKNTTKQGDLGEARAIYEYSKMGHSVSRTLFDSEKYDLIVDDGESLKRVQVKTTASKSDYGIYMCGLKTCGGNQSYNTIRKREDDDYDLLFVLADSGECWSIPESELPRNSINLGKKYNQYRI